MKHLFTFLFFCFDFYAASAQVGIGTSTPHPAAALDITSNDRGLLIPRVTEANRPGSPGKPAATEGLLIYQTDNDAGIYMYQLGFWAKMYRSTEASPNSYAYFRSSFPSNYVLNATPNGITYVSFTFGQSSSDYSLETYSPTGVTVARPGVYRVEYDVTPISVSGSRYQVILTKNNVAVAGSALISSDSNPNVHGNIMTSAERATKIGIIILPYGNTTSSLTFGRENYDHGVSLKISRLTTY